MWKWKRRKSGTELSVLFLKGPGFSWQLPAPPLARFYQAKTLLWSCRSWTRCRILCAFRRGVEQPMGHSWRGKVWWSWQTDKRVFRTWNCSSQVWPGGQNLLKSVSAWLESLCRHLVPSAWLADRWQPGSSGKGLGISLPCTNLVGSLWKQMGWVWVVKWARELDLCKLWLICPPSLWCVQDQHQMLNF